MGNESKPKGILDDFKRHGAVLGSISTLHVEKTHFKNLDNDITKKCSDIDFSLVFAYYRWFFELYQTKKNAIVGIDNTWNCLLALFPFYCFLVRYVPIHVFGLFSLLGKFKYLLIRDDKKEKSEPTTLYFVHANNRVIAVFYNSKKTSRKKPGKGFTLLLQIPAYNRPPRGTDAVMTVKCLDHLPRTAGILDHDDIAVLNATVSDIMG